MASMLVIGLGRFGKHLAIELTGLGHQVLVIDTDQTEVSKIAPQVTAAQIGDCMDIEVLRRIGVRQFDVCFVCISDNFQSSLEITSLLKELGAAYVVAKADRDIHAKFLRKVGADEVVYPERDMALRAAVRYSSRAILDYFELTPECAIFEMAVPAAWVGKSIRQLDIRAKHRINLIGLKANGQVTPLTDAEHVLQASEQLVAAGAKSDLLKLLHK